MNRICLFLVCSFSLPLLFPQASAEARGRSGVGDERRCEELAAAEGIRCAGEHQCGFSHGDPSDEEQEENSGRYEQCREERESACAARRERVFNRCMAGR